MPEQTRDLSLGEALDYGCQMAAHGNHKSAIGLFKGVLIHEPKNLEAIERLGASLFEIGSVHEALYWFWRGRKLDRRNPQALSNYGLCLAHIGHPDEGVIELEKAVYQAERVNGINPGAKALCYNNLGNALERLKRHPEALKVLDRGIALDPKDPFPHYNRGIVLLRLNRHEEAIRSLELSLSLRQSYGPDVVSRLNDADAYYNRGMARLLLGDFKGGFADYEFRLLTSENEAQNLGFPPETKWTGAEPIDGKRVLVHCEQGMGDDIQFMRFLEPLRAMNPAEILLITHNAIKPLVETIPDITVMTPHEVLNDRYDVWVPLMSLPLCLGIEREDQLPGPWRPRIEADRIVTWSPAVRDPDKLNVGICWAGNWRHKNNEHRSIALETFARLFDVEGVNFVSLQQVQPFEAALLTELKTKYPNLRTFPLEDFRDTAAVMLNLDRVISVDTAVAHLSATLDVPTSILVPAYSTDWRWMLKREDSPWYPAARLYRQPKVGDWKSVIASLRNELAATAAERKAA